MGDETITLGDGMPAGPDDPTQSHIRPNDETKSIKGHPTQADSIEEIIIESSTKPPKRQKTSAGLQPGDLLGSYEIERFLARGGMGAVYIAKHRTLGRKDVIKIMLGAADQRMQERFLREAQATAQLQHPHIVKVHAANKNKERDIVYIAMDYVKGTDLDKLITDEAIKGRKALELMSKVARAVDYANSMGVVHRDLKPANILVNEQGEPFVADFGLAKIIKEEAKSLTKSHEVMGTPQYMSPEQAASSKEVDNRTDIWALGAILYELLTGEKAFTGTTPINVLASIMKDDPVSMRTFNPAIRQELQAIVDKTLEKTLEQRYQTAGELADELERYLNDEPVHAKPIGKIGRFIRRAKRQPAKYSSIAAAALIMAIATPLTISALSTASTEAEKRQQETAKREKIEKAEQARLAQEQQEKKLKDTAWPHYQAGKQWYEKADIAKRQRQWELAENYQNKSLEALAQALDIYPKIADAFFIQGSILSEQMQREPARESLTQALTLNPANALAHYERGMLIAARTDETPSPEELASTEKDYKNILKLGIAQDKADMLAAVLHYYKEDYATALKHANAVLVAYPNFEEALYQRARIHKKQGNLDDAVTDLKKLLTFNERMYHAHNSIGLIYIQQEKYHEAADSFATAVKLNSNPITTRNLGLAHEHIGRTHYYQREFATAITEWEKSKSLFSTDEDLKRINHMIALAEQQAK